MASFEPSARPRSPAAPRLQEEQRPQQGKLSPRQPHGEARIPLHNVLLSPSGKAREVAELPLEDERVRAPGATTTGAERSGRLRGPLPGGCPRSRDAA